jgi:uncharacterized membrane protein
MDRVVYALIVLLVFWLLFATMGWISGPLNTWRSLDTSVQLLLALLTGVFVTTVLHHAGSTEKVKGFLMHAHQKAKNVKIHLNARRG